MSFLNLFFIYLFFSLLSEWYWMLRLIPTFHFKKGNILKLEKIMTPILWHSPAILFNISDREIVL